MNNPYSDINFVGLFFWAGVGIVLAVLAALALVGAGVYWFWEHLVF